MGDDSGPIQMGYVRSESPDDLDTAAAGRRDPAALAEGTGHRNSDGFRTVSYLWQRGGAVFM